ncbi:MAG: type III-B CRISPR module RAMP protein Cmr6 [Syntrophus sp. (in: bacteria)]
MGNKDDSLKQSPFANLEKKNFSSQNDYRRDKGNIANKNKGQPFKPQTHAPRDGRHEPQRHERPNDQGYAAKVHHGAHYSYPLPKDVNSLMGDDRPCENFSLLFHRYVPGGGGKEAKIGTWKKIRDTGNQLHENDLVRFFLKRQASLAAALKAIGDDQRVLDWQGKTVARLSIGFGDAGPLDTGITLHRLYGIPYLPATAVKGVCRAWALNDIAMGLGVTRLSPEDEDRHDHFRRIFGNQNRRGEVHFYDAFPLKVPNILFDLDIINVHYQAYYESKGKTLPADYLSPVPIFFLTVAPDVPFRFLVTCDDPALRVTVEDWLTAALAQFGIGAKTALGYGEIKRTNLS